MKTTLGLLLILIPITLHALPCPNGGGFLYKGTSIDEVLKQCGEPAKKFSATRVTYTLQELLYYRNHLYDPGYTKIWISIRNGYVSNIQIDEQPWLAQCRRSAVQVGQVSTIQTSCGPWIYNTQASNLCGGIFSLGDTIQRVEAVCGQPVEKRNLETIANEMTEFTYDGRFPQTIIFEDGKLVEWK